MMKKVLVTGGGGFLGSAIVRQLLVKGCDVKVAGRHRYEQIERLGARCLVGDIADSNFTAQACQDVDTVFHVAAKAGIWGNWNDYRNVNIDGTVNIADSCLKNGVACLVYTSTPSVVFNHANIENGNENLAYAQKFLCSYAKSKVTAERYLLETISKDLPVCALRPHLIWGPGDPHLIPRLIERGRKGKLKIVGDGRNRVDITYVENAAHAHILAAENLHHSSRISGRAYFIGQERPVYLWDWINDLYRELGIAQLEKKVPLAVAYLAGWLLEILHRMPMVSKEPSMTRFLALQLSRSHYFSHDRAKKDLGYEPLISIEEGKKRLLETLAI
ncbi:MAG: NAD-dependent epimerase/dehydratase family protein [Desulfocapsaceae bacterium]